MSIISVPILVRGRHVMDSQYMPAEELPRRRAAMGELLVRRGLDGVICYADSSCNGYVEYFTNYNCATPFTNALFLLTADGRSLEDVFLSLTGTEREEAEEEENG